MIFKKKKRERDAKLAIAAANKRYLIDCYGDAAFLNRMIELVNRDPELRVDIVLSDNTKVQVYSHRDSHRNIIWDRAE